MTEFRTIKKEPDFLIGSNGKVIDKRTNEEIKPHTNIIGRPSVDLNGKNYSLDLLVALTFLSEQEGYLIKHRNGDINDISVDNLYWFLPEFEKTIDNGNETKIPIFTINEEGEIMEEFNTISEASYFFFDTDTSSLYYSIRNKTFNKAVDGYVCKQEDYDLEFIDYVLDDVKNNSFYIVKLNGDIVRYRTVEKLLKDYPKLKQTSIYNNSKSHRLCYSNIIDGYICYYRDIEKCKEKAKERYDKKVQKELKEMQRKDKTVYLVDISGNIIKEYSSPKEIVKEYNIEKINYIYNAISILLYSHIVDAFIVYKRDWNEDKRKEILSKKIYKK